MIVSAHYNVDDTGQQTGITLVLEDGSQPSVAIDGKTWLNQALNAWVEAGNTIAPAPTA